MAKNTDCALEIERLRGIIARNCDWGQAKVLSSEKTDAEAIKAICDAADAVRIEDVPSAKFNPVAIIGPIEQSHAANELPQPLTDTPPKSLTDMPPTHSYIRALTNGTIERCAQVAENFNAAGKPIAAALRNLKEDAE